MLAKTYGAAVQGIDANLVTIEVNITNGIRFSMVGLPDNAVKESRERIYSSFQVNHIPLPRKQVVINMAPADIRKEGSAYDLPLAIGLLAANETIPSDEMGNFLLMGELSLDGTLKPIKGALPIAILARELGYKGIILPRANTKEAAVVNKLIVYAADSIVDVVHFFQKKSSLKQIEIDTRQDFINHQEEFTLDFEDVKGQESVKRALEVAAAGGHNLIMIGPPGAGKSMMAKRLPSILPNLTLQEALETTKIHSVAGLLNKDTALMTQRPFRNPHHTISNVALVGGGSYPQPGEISLAHNGVLFLDELPEFQRYVLEMLRQPLEDRKISISRAKFTVEYPASFMLVASMNPCPCGYYNHPSRECTCTPYQIMRYLSKISGPLLDRIDMHVEIIPVPFEELSQVQKSESSRQIRQRVIQARQIQTQRFKSIENVHCNAQMSSRMVHEYAEPDTQGRKLLKTAMSQRNLSARAYDRILKLARTIADLDQQEKVGANHIAEAINYRNLDKEDWLG
jgi:magnesium chelatase family protein